MIRRLPVLLGLALLALLAASAGAETAALLYDVNSASPDDVRGGFQGGLYPLGDKALFLASEPGSGVELWATDGTALGTRLVADVCAGPCSSEIRFMGTVGGSPSSWPQSERRKETSHPRSGAAMAPPGGPIRWVSGPCHPAISAMVTTTPASTPSTEPSFGAPTAPVPAPA
ncbi:MAG: hypothetical protein QOH06_5849 [Acidobacteriota bacterium]|nr:hypothetical protein [Acidobacteriota bacterium]